MIDMNERIKELAKQATQEFSPAFDRDKWQDKFAELIIKKCVMIGNYAHDGGEYPGPMIKEYFGVE
jgi:non-homologous end joining protein Ku